MRKSTVSGGITREQEKSKLKQPQSGPKANESAVRNPE